MDSDPEIDITKKMLNGGSAITESTYLDDDHNSGKLELANSYVLHVLWYSSISFLSHLNIHRDEVCVRLYPFDVFRFLPYLLISDIFDFLRNLVPFRCLFSCM